MKKPIKLTIVALMAVFLVASGIKAQNHLDTTKAHQHMMKKNMQNNKMMDHGKMKKNHEGIMGHSNKMDAKKGMANNMVHEGIIDVQAIDQNKDGKVYQDMMDWNVISDKPGKCPKCGMKLKEVSIDEANQNFKKHGFKTK